ncbi:MAG: SDR family oxidoreductase [Rikenellaceae bacterium]
MILITGASKGIGAFLFNKFKDEGYDVRGTYNSTCRNDNHLERVDVSDFNSVTKWISSLEKDLSDVTLINCAAISDACFLHKSDPEMWSKIISTNIIGSYNTIRQVLPIMRQQKWGRIINFSSVLAKLPTPYATSKAALEGLTKTIAVENGALGITANTISLGYAEIGMGINDVSEKHREKMLERIPVGRFCSPEEIYEAILFIIKNSYINGASIDLNGGIL